MCFCKVAYKPESFTLAWFGMRKRFRQQGCNKSSCAPWGQKYNSNPHGGSNISNATISLLLLQRALGILVGAEKMVMKSGIRKERSYNSKMAKTDITLITRGVHFELQVAPRVGAWWNVSRGAPLVVDSLFFNGQSRTTSCWTLKITVVAKTQRRKKKLTKSAKMIKDKKIFSRVLTVKP